jgi:hypothetical protein
MKTVRGWEQMADYFEHILDECIDRVNRGERVEKCLADYPQYAGQLEPLLRALTQTQMACDFTPSADAQRAGRQRLYAALEKRRRPSFWQQVFGRRSVWAAVVGTLVVLAVAYYVVKPALFPAESPGGNIAQPPPASSQPTAPTALQPAAEPSPQANPLTTPGPTVEPTPEPPVEYIAQAKVDGNFIFLVSDEVNAIAEFSNVEVNVKSVRLLQSSGRVRWMEFTPETKQFDLTLLPGAKTQQLWRGDIPEGQYAKASIEVASVRGTLKASGETIDIKLPGNRLEMTLPFEVGPGSVTSFTYDLTVFNRGSAKEGGKYLLKEQPDQSESRRDPVQKSGKEQNGALPPDTSTPPPVNTSRRD